MCIGVEFFFIRDTNNKNDNYLVFLPLLIIFLLYFFNCLRQLTNPKNLIVWIYQ